MELNICFSFGSTPSKTTKTSCPAPQKPLTLAYDGDMDMWTDLYTSGSQRSSQPQTKDYLPSDRCLMTVLPLLLQEEKKKSHMLCRWRLVEALEPSSFTGNKVQVVVCLILISWGRYQRQPFMTLKDNTTERLTFDFVSSVLDLKGRGNVKRLVGKQAFLFWNWE